MAPFNFIVVIPLFIVGCNSQFTKTWRFNTDFENPENWDRNAVPCKTSTVVFPSEKKVPVELPEIKSNGSMVEVNKLILSREGSLILPSNGGVALSSLQRYASCVGGEFNFVRTGAKKWVDPDNWITSSTTSKHLSPATPHLERIPCVHDLVEFINDRSVYIDLPSRQVNVFGIQMQGMTFTEPTAWKTFLLDGAHSFFPGLITRGTDMLTVTGDQCDVISECECGNSYLYEDVCSKKWKWQEPHCAQPVTPIGFCFPICGAFLLYEKSSVSNVNSEVTEFLKMYDVEYHVSKVNGFVQVVLTEKGEYSGSIHNVAKELHHHLLKKNLVSDVTSALHISGLRISEVDLVQTLIRFFLGFFITLLTFSVIFFSYENYCLNWQRTISILRGRDNERLGFARFENKSGTVEIGREALLRQGTYSPEQAIAFDNPMFSKVDSTLGTSNLIPMEPQLESGRKHSDCSLDTDSGSLGDTDSVSHDEISMREVILGTGNTRSEDESSGPIGSRLLK